MEKTMTPYMSSRKTVKTFFDQVAQHQSHVNPVSQFRVDIHRDNQESKSSEARTIEGHPFLGKSILEAIGSSIDRLDRLKDAIKQGCSPAFSTSTTLTPQAHRIFQESFDSFEETINKYSRTDDREFNETTLRDVRDAAKQVERQLAVRQCMRNMRRLEPLLDGLDAFSKVIEVLCNDTRLLSWIWAPIKLMLQLAVDHISALEKLLAAYSQIAAMLPRFDQLGTAWQDKPDFQQALAVVYSDILAFHEHAYKLFRRNGWICFFKSSWGQFGSRFNCILDSLAKQATLIDQEANAYLVSETMQWRREALQAVAKTERDRSTAQLTAALAWLGLETVPHCGQAYQYNLLHRLINECCDGTTGWILEHHDMRQWLRNRRGHPILWLKGKPGSGKSTLCAKMVQFLRTARQSTVLFCFYSYIVSSTYPDPVVFILATLVAQILRQRTDLATYVYEDFVAESRPLSIRSLQELLSNLLPQLAMPRILIDGIDECIRYDMQGKPSDLSPVKEVLASILQLESPTQASTPTKILVVSRDILEVVGKLSKRPTVALDKESDALTADITRYAAKSLETIRERFENLSGVDDILQDVRKNVVSRSQGMFLWVRLVLAQLELDAYNLDDLENAVANMPHSLNDFYSRIVHRIMLYSPLSRERTINILKWMLCSRRPLRIIELRDAIVFASGAVSLSERSQLPSSVVELCKPLIQTDDNGQVSFVHFTVQEYLVKSGFISLRDAEGCTTITCLNYLTFGLSLSNPNIPAMQKAVDVGKGLYSLQPYIHEHWFDHLLTFAAEVSQARDPQMEDLLASFLFIYSHQYTRYLDLAEDVQVDIVAARNLEPRLENLEHYEHHYRFLCAYVVYRHAKRIHFEKPADYREPLDPTPLSFAQLEYATQVDYLLSAVAVPGLTSEHLIAFKTSNCPYAFVCRPFELPPPVHRYPFTNTVTTSQSSQDPTTIGNLLNVQQNEVDPDFFDFFSKSRPEFDYDFTPPSRTASHYQYPLSNQTNTMSPPEINIDFAPPSRSASLDRYFYEYEPSAVTQSVSQSNKADIRPVPKFERTYSDIATDNFYEPSTFIQPRPVYTDIAADNFYDPGAVIQSVSQLKPAQSSLLSPYRSNVSENVQRALQAAQYTRSQSPSSNAAGSDSPFRQNSPYRPPSNRFNTPMNTAPPSVQASFGLPSRQMSPDRDARLNQANVMSPPEINIDFAPPSRQKYSQPRDATI
ncbi:unnamed protein product [Alternaria alternata]